jgi:hypothetical protein
MIDDKAFNDYARKAELEAQEKKAKAGNGNSTFSFENIFHAAWEKKELNRMKIVRALGGVPNSGTSPDTALTARVAMIVADNGKKFRCVLPDPKDQPNNIIWRIINRVNETTYVNKKRVNINETKHPELFNMINHNGYKEGTKQNLYDKGWLGRVFLAMNVIDREKMEWHKKNKHSLLLAKEVNVGEDGKEWPEYIPSYGFLNLLQTGIFKYYGDWRKYDLGVIRLGLKETPFRIINASKYLEEVPEELKPLVSHDDFLTPEEESWEKYDLTKLFKVTNATKIYNRLKLAIAKIDAVLGTKFIEELEDLVEAEKKAFEAAKADKPTDEVAEDVPENKEEGLSTSPEGYVTADKATFLKGWKDLSDEQKSKIKDINVKDRKVVDITYDNGLTLVKCPTCYMPGPEVWPVCPACGEKF